MLGRDGKLGRLIDERVSQVQQALREALLKTGRFYITGTKLDGVYALRVTVMNPASACSR